MCVSFLTVYLYLVVYIKFTYIILGYLLFLEDLQKCKCLRQFKTTLKTIKILFKTWTEGSGLWKQQKAKSISIILNLIIPYDHNILLRNIFIWKIIYSRLHLGFPSSSTVKNLPAGDMSLIPGLKIPWRRTWQPTPGFLPGESSGQRSLADYSPWGCKESDTTERLTHFTEYGPCNRYLKSKTHSIFKLEESSISSLNCVVQTWELRLRERRLPCNLSREIRSPDFAPWQ